MKQSPGLPPWFSRRQELLKAAAERLAQRASWVVSKLDGEQHRFHATLILTSAQLCYLCSLWCEDCKTLGDYMGRELSNAAAERQARFGTTVHFVSLTATSLLPRDLDADEVEPVEHLLSFVPVGFGWHDEMDPTFEATCWLAGMHGSRRPLHWHLCPAMEYQGLLQP